MSKWSMMDGSPRRGIKKAASPVNQTGKQITAAKNRTKLRLQDVVEELEARGISPVGAILDAINKPADESGIDDRFRIQAFIALLPYAYPRKSSVETKQDITITEVRRTIVDPNQ